LGWPCATFAATIVESDDGTLTVEREVDGGVDRLLISPPAIISVDLRIVASKSIRSRITPAEHHYPPGVRFASLPAILQSKRKPLEVFSVEALYGTLERNVVHTSYYLPNVRTAGRKVQSVEELIACLVTEAKVL
jgi:electron transfer flavoprotein beta subunit